jgi:hypothetical protein
MTHTEDLIARLRDTASRGVSSWGDLQQEAADHIAGQDLLIEVLKKQLSAVAAEREACAKVCETYETASATSGDKAIAWIFNHCSARIRARGEA